MFCRKVLKKFGWNLLSLGQFTHIAFAAFCIPPRPVKGKDGKPKAFIKLKHTYNWKTKTLTPTKSGHERTIDVSAIRDYLLARKGTATDKDWVFPRSNLWEKGKAASIFRAALKDVGYKPEKKINLIKMETR